MAYTKTTWSDRIVQNPLTYTQQTNADGTITLIPAEGTITQSGTPLTASALQNIEDGVGNNDTRLTSIEGNAKLQNILGWFTIASGPSFPVSVWQRLAFDTTIESSGFTYNADNTFTFPKTGYYRIILRGGLYITSHTSLNIDAWKIGGATGTERHLLNNFTIVSESWNMFTATGILNCAAGDQYEFVLKQDGGYATNVGYDMQIEMI